MLLNFFYLFCLQTIVGGGVMKDKFFDAAKAAALASEGVGKRKNFKHGAVLVHKNTVIASGFNSYKTHPIMAKYTHFPHLHAEQKAIIRAGLDNCEGLDLYVVRVDRRKRFAMSKPCRVCKKLIDEVGIRNVYYTDESGNFI